ncbi:MAG: response regulator [Candidatus Eremiobacterota bacterium]
MKPLQILYLVASHLDSLQIQSILSEGGIQSETVLVDNEENFISAIEKNSFDIIFTDYRIPPFDGMSALKIAMEKCPEIPVIFITDKLGEEFAVETLHHGAVDYILKNSIKRLIPAVKRALKITEERKKLKEAEETIKKERDLLQTITDNIGAGVALISKDYKTLWANDFLKKKFGDVENKCCFLTYNKRNEICPDCGVRDVFDRGKEISIHEQKGKDINGNVIWSQIIATPFKDTRRNVVSALEIVLPVTEKKIAEESLRKSERIFRNIVENTSNWIWEYDCDGLFTYSNGRVKDILGYAPEEILGKSMFDFIGKNDGEADHKSILNTVSSMIHKHGYIVEMDTKVIPFYNEDGNLKGYHGISRDITDLKKSERENIKIKEELEDRVIDRTIQLAVLNRELKDNIEERKKIEKELVIARNIAESASVAKSDFISSMSHEFRTPLNSILGYAQLFLNDEALSDDYKRGINIIFKSGKHLLGLINDVMDMAKIERENMELDEKPFNLPGMLDFIKNVIDVNVRKKELLFLFDYSPLIPDIVLGDEKRLSQVLINLLSNAVKFTEKGHIILKVDNIEGKIVFTVEDTGIGIPEDKLKEIFQPFKQITPMLKKTDGTGLGLSISRKLVKLMGGELCVESCHGKSSRFWFSLDLPEVSPGEICDSNDKGTISGYKGYKRKILVVDDKIWNREVIVEFLASKGFEVEEAGSGSECMNKLNSFKPDLIFMDIIMPDMDGFEITRKIRDMPECKDIKIIAISASSPEEWIDGLVIFDDFIGKPFLSKSLLEVMKKYLALEWIYMEEDGNHIFDEKDIMEIPSSEILKSLYYFIRDGNIKAFKSELARVNNDKYEVFYGKLKELSDNFEVERLVKILEKHIEKE